MIDIIFYDVDINFYTPYFDESMTNWKMTPIQSIEIMEQEKYMELILKIIVYIFLKMKSVQLIIFQ